MFEINAKAIRYNVHIKSNKRLCVLIGECRVGNLMLPLTDFLSNMCCTGLNIDLSIDDIAVKDSSCSIIAMRDHAFLNREQRFKEYYHNKELLFIIDDVNADFRYLARYVIRSLPLGQVILITNNAQDDVLNYNVQDVYQLYYDKTVGTYYNKRLY